MLLRNFLLIISVPVFFLISCREPEVPENKAMEKKLMGEWKSVSIKITMNTFRNKDSTKMFEVNESDWEQKMKIRPIRTIFFGDGTYFSEHSNLRDSIIYSPAGRWVIFGDTLMMRDTFPEPALAYRYKIEIKNNLVELTGMEDCDRDGATDDNYYGVQRKQKRKSFQ